MFSLFAILGQESLKKMVAQNNRKIIEFLYQNQTLFFFLIMYKFYNNQSDDLPIEGQVLTEECQGHCSIYGCGRVV
jgi:hypothetical protein